MIYRSSKTPIKIPASFFAKTDKLILKFIWKVKGPRIAKIILGKKGQAGVSHFRFQNLLKATVIKTVWEFPSWRSGNESD